MKVKNKKEGKRKDSLKNIVIGIIVLIVIMLITAYLHKEYEIYKSGDSSGSIMELPILSFFYQTNSPTPYPSSSPTPYPSTSPTVYPTTSPTPYPTSTIKKCTTDDDCKIYESQKACKIETGECVQCVENKHCNRYQFSPICKKDINKCVQCLTNNDCANQNLFKVCDPTKFVCTASCFSDNDCVTLYGNSLPLCNKIAHKCYACKTKDDCKNYPTPNYKLCQIIADGYGYCVPCFNDNDCIALDPNKPRCVFNGRSNLCGQCKTDADCANVPEKPICIPVLYECGQCKTNSDCKNPDAPYCNNDNWCGECINDQECKTKYGILLPVCETDLAFCIEGPTCSLANDNADCPTRERPFCAIIPTLPGGKLGIPTCRICLNDLECQDRFEHSLYFCDKTNNVCEVNCAHDWECENVLGMEYLCDLSLSKCVKNS